jgi:hypothetical protein
MYFIEPWKNETVICLIYIENPTRCHSVSKFYFIFIWSSTCVGRHAAHHREPKTALAASGFAYVEGCWTCSCWTLSVRAYSTWQRPATTRPTTFHVHKTRGGKCSFRLPMMGGVSPETCWASCKYEIKFWYTVAPCWIFYVNYTAMHGSMNIKSNLFITYVIHAKAYERKIPTAAARILFEHLALNRVVSYLPSQSLTTYNCARVIHKPDR